MPITDESDLGSAGSTGSYILGTLNDDDVDWLVDHGQRRTESRSVGGGCPR